MYLELEAKNLEYEASNLGYRAKNLGYEAKNPGYKAKNLWIRGEEHGTWDRSNLVTRFSITRGSIV